MLYTHHYRKEFRDRFHGIMDTRRWGPGEMGAGSYEAAVISLETA